MHERRLKRAWRAGKPDGGGAARGRTRRHLRFALTPLWLCATAARLQAGDADAARQLAAELASEGRHEPAAIEYRRLALDAETGERRGGYYWAAAYAYWRAGDHERVVAMLDRAEDSAPDLTTESLLLRGEAALAARRKEQALFYLQSVVEGEGPAQARAYAVRRLAGALLSAGELPAARTLLAKEQSTQGEALAALDRHAKGRGRNPALGGILGIVPGLGYAYSGEYANALRSLILNGIFIYGLLDTADHEQWGAFGVVAFFELTWYTGSIYGGIDAAHRYNQTRLDACREAVDGGTGFSLDWRQVPVVCLRFSF
ncbi:MAG: hypothetical protein JXR37_25265 [Kiritimatiellae bacterium]|nr:hypothetical protein [Kiritimatiellia bacterium]